MAGLGSAMPPPWGMPRSLDSDRGTRTERLVRDCRGYFGLDLGVELQSQLLVLSLGHCGLLAGGDRLALDVILERVHPTERSRCSLLIEELQVQVVRRAQRVRPRHCPRLRLLVVLLYVVVDVVLGFPLEDIEFVRPYAHALGQGIVVLLDSGPATPRYRLLYQHPLDDRLPRLGASDQVFHHRKLCF